RDDLAPGGRRHEPSKEGLPSGPAVENFVLGVPHRDPNTGDVLYDLPHLYVTEPVDNSTLHGLQDRAEEALLSMAKQRHRIIAGDAVVSGEARVQARQEFEVSLLPTARGVTHATRRLLFTACAYVRAAT